jgi:hypothetical protein
MESYRIRLRFPIFFSGETGTRCADIASRYAVIAPNVVISLDLFPRYVGLQITPKRDRPVRRDLCQTASVSGRLDDDVG